MPTGGAPPRQAPVSLAGNFLKQSKVVKAWRKRWVVFQSQPSPSGSQAATLAYWGEQQDAQAEPRRKPKGTGQITACATHRTRPYTVTLTIEGGEVFHLQAVDGAKVIEQLWELLQRTEVRLSK